MLITKKKLAIEVAEVDCVKIDDVDFAEAGKDKVLQEFAANASSADQQDPRLYK